jgi:flagella basal body P-ring formation protein FlgA
MVSGPDEVNVLAGEPSEESTGIATTLDGATIENAIRDALAERFHLAPEDLEVHLAGPLAPLAEIAGASSGRLRIKPYLPSTLRLGRTQMRVGLSVGDEFSKTINVAADIAKYQDIARAIELIMPGDPFTDQNIKTVRQRTTSYAQYVSAIDAIGRKAKRSIRAGEAVRVYDIDDRRDTSPVLVKPRDRVHLVARKGRLTVTLTDAEVLKSGRLGEYILVKNPSSGKQVTGRVLSRSEVEVNF